MEEYIMELAERIARQSAQDQVRLWFLLDCFRDFPKSEQIGTGQPD